MITIIRLPENLRENQNRVSVFALDAKRKKNYSSYRNFPKNRLTVQPRVVFAPIQGNKPPERADRANNPPVIARKPNADPNRTGAVSNDGKSRQNFVQTYY